MTKKGHEMRQFSNFFHDLTEAKRRLKFVALEIFVQKGPKMDLK